MTDTPPPASEPRQTDKWLEPGPENMTVIYVLYLAAFVVGITGIIGVVLAYMGRDKVDGWLRTHYDWAIRTFWIGMLYSVIALLLFVVIIGMPLMIAVAVLIVVRVVIGLQKLSRREPVANPQSWFI